MTLRHRFLITAALLCHLLLAPPLVTSQLPPANGSSAKPRAEASSEKSVTAPTTPCGRAFAESNNRATVCAIEQEREGVIYKLHGAVEIYYENYVLRSDEATFNSDTNEATASGHFALRSEERRVGKECRSRWS